MIFVWLENRTVWSSALRCTEVNLSRAEFHKESKCEINYWLINILVKILSRADPSEQRTYEHPCALWIHLQLQLWLLIVCCGYFWQSFMNKQLYYFHGPLYLARWSRAPRVRWICQCILHLLFQPVIQWDILLFLRSREIFRRKIGVHPYCIPLLKTSIVYLVCFINASRCNAVLHSCNISTKEYFNVPDLEF